MRIGGFMAGSDYVDERAGKKLTPKARYAFLGSIADNVFLAIWRILA